MKTKVDKIIEVTDNSRDYLQAVYLDYINNFLTVERFASVYNIDIINAGILIGMAKRVHDQRTGQV